MRVVGGKYRNRRLRPPATMDARPTTDYAKEGLFNMLAHSMALEGIRVLDLFSGTGNIAVEFLSRGAAEVVSVDREPRLVAFQERAAAELGITGWRMVKTDVFALLNDDAHRRAPLLGSAPFDVVFADPPFGMPGTDTIAALVRERGLLADGGRFILEHPKEVDPSGDPWFVKQRRFGAAVFSFFMPPAP
jgi:16S rRNA (guanine(966)-N(2))-methyltransferase RsmD